MIRVLKIFLLIILLPIGCDDDNNPVVQVPSDGSDENGENEQMSSCLGDQDICLTLDGENLNYSSAVDIAGFQIDHDGCVSGASGGEAANADFTVSVSGSVVLGFSFTGSILPAGDNLTLTVLDGDVSQDCLSAFVFSGAGGTGLSSEWAVSECSEGFVENPNYQEGENHQLCVPGNFVYYTSPIVAYYFIDDIYFDGNPISDNDWIASFNDDICVGAKRWGDCPEEDSHCELVASGKIGNDFTGNSDEYLEFGDIPAFKIYIASEEEYYDASVFESVDPFANQYIQFFNSLLVACSDGSIPNLEGNCD